MLERSSSGSNGSESNAKRTIIPPKEDPRRLFNFMANVGEIILHPTSQTKKK